MMCCQLLSRIFGLIVGIFFLIACILLSAMSSQKWELDNVFTNNLDTSELLWEKDGISMLTCASLCNQKQSCLSFFFNPSLMKCLGSKSFKRGLPAGQATQQGWNCYTKPQQCDGDYVNNQSLGLCYKVHYETRNATEAMAACETEGAKLIILRNKAEFETIQAIVFALRNASYGVLTGLRDANDMGDWKWWNGQAVSYLPWGPKQPNYAGETCGAILYELQTTLYHDVNCSVGRFFLCQRYI